MQVKKIRPIILCGGSGTRLWPLSRQCLPKQFISLVDDNSLFQKTMLRLQEIPYCSEPIIICNEEHRFIVAQQIQNLNLEKATIILEPIGKNTAPAVTISALAVNPDEILLILPSDHLLNNTINFSAAITNAIKLVEMNYLVTFGIEAKYPETGYGYIKKSSAIDVGFKVEKFIEKPDSKTAEGLIQTELCYWNSGIFMFTAGQYLTELNKTNPQMIETCKLSYQNATIDLDFIRLHKETFESCATDSIDYAVMEKSDCVAVIPLTDNDWNDVGSWQAVFSLQQQDEYGNVVIGDVVSENVSNSYLHSEHRLIAAVGIEDHIIVETADAVLVAHKNKTQDVKKIVNLLVQNKRREFATHRKVYRPWGYYEIIELTEHFQIKQLCVHPGAALSLQSHQYRSEHWIVIQGTAEVRCEKKKLILKPNQSTYIPHHSKHKLSNPGTDLLIIVEVQTGSYFGEDDIERFSEVEFV